jgi:SAM-dependent methyltransferase
VLIDFEHSLFDPEAYSAFGKPQPPGGAPLATGCGQHWRSLRKRLLRGSNVAAERAAARFLAEIAAAARGNRPRILVVGGGTIGSGAEALYCAKGIDVVGTDVFPSGITQIVSDAHRLPFADESFDGVWVQAVLEHVLEPGTVVQQIHRVLRPAGVVFADTPFMQQVHMGAYDFTRFTLSGHRWLFRRFTQIDAGISGGPGIAAIWSLRYLARSLGAPPALAGAIAAPFFWLRFFDRFARGRNGADAASGVFFLGRKCETALGPKDMVAYYESGGKP